MDNPEDLVRTLEGQVERLKVIFNEATSALTDDVTEVSQFCVSLECILRHHQKEKVSFWGDRRDYWNYLSEGVGRMKTLEGIVKQTQALTHLSYGQGRGRALIRCCLEEHMLADIIQTSISNIKRTREWYLPSAVLLSKTHSERIIVALYDLSEVDFDLPSEGVELDETWPSFVLKSFQSSDAQRSLFGAFSPPTKDAIATSKKSPAQHQSFLERGVEEEASEVYIKQEIPFSIELVSSLLDDIRCNLVGQSETIGGQTHLCPELEVAKLDDITSCLTILRDYITSWSRDITKNSHTLQEEARRSKVRLADVELQLEETMRESEGVERSLLNQLQDTRDDLQTCSNQIQELINDNTTLKSHQNEGRLKISELENLNFSLEEQLMEAQEEEGEEGGEEEGERVEGEGVDGEEGGGGRKRRAITLMETSLRERDQTIQELSQVLADKEEQLLSLKEDLTSTRHQLHQLSPLTSLLQQQLAAETEAKAVLCSNYQQQKDLYSDLERHYQESVAETEVLRGRGQMEEELQTKYDQLRSQHDALNSALEELRVQTREEVERELKEMEEQLCVLRDEASSLRYQLSSTSMEAQQTKEAVTKHESSLSSLCSELSQQKQLLKRTEEKYQASEEQVHELRRELQDVETLLHTQDEDMASLSEQLTEKTLSRDKERADILKLHNSLDSVQVQLATEKQELMKEISRLSDENSDIRRAFRRLLQQKVTLWQHADELEQEQLQMGTWVNSKQVTECMECACVFTVFTRKHHCRSCGKVYCSKCCEKKTQLPFSKEPVRVCVKCHQRIDQLRTPLVSKLINSELEGIDTLSLARRSSNGGSELAIGAVADVSNNSFSDERSVETAGNSLHAKLCLQNADDDSSVPSSYGDKWRTFNGSTTAIDGESTMSFAGSDTYETAPSSLFPGQGDRPGSEIEDYSVEPEPKEDEEEEEEREREARGSAKQEEGTDAKTETSYHISAVEGDSLDESYYLIEASPQFPVGLDVPGNRFLDVNALASKLASLEVTREGANVGGGADSSAILAPPRGNYERGAGSFTEILLKGGQAHRVPVEVDKKGTVVSWEFSSEPKGLAFGLSVVEDVPGARSEQVLPLRRCVSHKITLTGEYVAQKAGTYHLCFDNCHSKYSGRKLFYRVWKKPPL